jgi:hypothetical protein
MEQLSFDDLEVWKPVVGWEGLYEVSSLGRVQSLPRRGGNNRVYGGRLLRPHPGHEVNGKSYLEVGLCRGAKCVNKRVHKLVAEAFLGPCLPGQEVRHGPAGHHDNRVLNLCYGTHAENIADRARDGTFHLGSGAYNAKLDEIKVAEIRRRYANGETNCGALARNYGVARASIRHVVQRASWKHVV